MKKLLTIAVLTLLAMGARAQQEVYDKYACREDVAVALALQLPVDRDTKIDAVMFHALDRGGWEWMQKEFALTPLMAQRNGGNGTRRAVVFSVRDQSDITRKVVPVGGGIDYARSCLMLADIKAQTVCVYFNLTQPEMERIISKYNNPNKN